MKIKRQKTNLIGTRVMQTRQAQGMSRQELVVKLQTHGIHMSPRTLSLLERKKRRVTDIEMDALSSVLNVLPTSLIERSM